MLVRLVGVYDRSVQMILLVQSTDAPNVFFVVMFISPLSCLVLLLFRRVNILANFLISFSSKILKKVSSLFLAENLSMKQRKI